MGINIYSEILPRRRLAKGAFFSTHKEQSNGRSHELTSCPCRIHRNNGNGISHCCDEHSSNVYILFCESPSGCTTSGLSASTSSARSQRTRSKKAAERAAATSSSHRMRRRVEEAASSSGP